FLAGCLPSTSRSASPDQGARHIVPPAYPPQTARPPGEQDIHIQNFGNATQDGTPIAPADSVALPVGETCYKGDAFICEIEAAIVRQTNALRAPARPFIHAGTISFVAREWSRE